MQAPVIPIRDREYRETKPETFAPEVISAVAYLRQLQGIRRAVWFLVGTVALVGAGTITALVLR